MERAGLEYFASLIGAGPSLANLGALLLLMTFWIHAQDLERLSSDPGNEAAADPEQMEEVI